MTAAAMSLLAACWSSQTQAYLIAAKDTVQVPLLNGERLTFRLTIGEQTELRVDNVCGETLDEDQQWKMRLEEDGFLAEAGGVIRTRSGPVFGLRFKRGGVYGDIVVQPSETTRCLTYIIRVQHAIEHEPIKWNSSFALSGLWRIGQSESLSARYFEGNAEFPSNYP